MDITLELNCSRCKSKYTTGGGGYGMCSSCSHDELVKMPEWIAFCEAIGFNPNARKVSDLWNDGTIVGDLGNNSGTDIASNRNMVRRKARQNSANNRRKKKDEQKKQEET
jgi:hypothetical protein